MLYKPAKVTPVGDDRGAQHRRSSSTVATPPRAAVRRSPRRSRSTRPAASSSPTSTTSSQGLGVRPCPTPVTARATATQPAPSPRRRWPPGSPATRPAPATRTSSSSATSTPTPRRTRSPPSRRPGSPTSSRAPRCRRLLLRLRRAVGLPRPRPRVAVDPLSQVTGVAEYHINADEPSVLDYNTDFKTPASGRASTRPTEFRVSDHDPVIVGLSPNSPATSTAAFADDLGVVRRREREPHRRHHRPRRR